MLSELQPYSLTFTAVGVLSALLLVQIAALDIMGLRAKHPAGTPIAADHSISLFRVSRVVGNTNESLGIFILLVIFCLGRNVSPFVTGLLSWVYVGARIAYTLCYYANIKRARSVMFGLAFFALLGLLLAGFWPN